MSAIKKIESVVKLSSEERYLYFIRKVADFERVWGLYHEGWALLSENLEDKIFPFWPEAEFADICAVGKWHSYVPKPIAVDVLLEKWLPGLRDDKMQVGVFYVPDGKGIVVSAMKLLEDIEEELKQYE